MSIIKPKWYNPTQKIVRSIFKGSPNLFTTSDLNRQIEALKSYSDIIENKIGVTTDIRFTFGIDHRSLTVAWSAGNIYVKGAIFSFEKGTTSLYWGRGMLPLYLHLVADTELVTYENDPTHEIAGASFEDGTTHPAADQIRYTEGSFYLNDSPTATNSIAVIGVWKNSGSSDTDVSIKASEVLQTTRTVPLDGGIFSRFEYEKIYPSTDKISLGDSYDMVISKLANRHNELSSAFESRSRYYRFTEAIWLPNPMHIFYGFRLKLPSFLDLSKLSLYDEIEILICAKVKLPGSPEGWEHDYTDVLVKFLWVDRETDTIPTLKDTVVTVHGRRQTPGGTDAQFLAMPVRVRLAVAEGGYVEILKLTTLEGEMPGFYDTSTAVRNSYIKISTPAWRTR